MPSFRQVTVEPDILFGDGSLGRSSQEELVAGYPGSPIHSGEMPPDSIREQYNEMVLSGKVSNPEGAPKIGLPAECAIGPGGSIFNVDFSENGAPEKSDDEIDVEGPPASPYMPNPVSPGPGSVNPLDQGKAPESFYDIEPHTPFIGEGVALTPLNSSKRISSQKLGDYIMGKSTPESQGALTHK